MEKVIDLYDLQQECRKFYHERCFVCGRHSLIVHEIIPRSHGKVAINIDNMVVLCNLHHEWAHSVGSKGSQKTLNIYKEQAITRYNKEK